MRFTLLFLTLISGAASAQFFDKQFVVGWTVNTPVANQEFLGKTSFRGFRFGYREMINEKVAVGIDLTTATYDDYIPRQTYTTSGGAFTTDFTNWANNYGATVSGEYYFRAEKRLMPYVGFGAGLAYNNYKIFYNIFSEADNVFGLLLRPRAGAWIKIRENRSWAVHVAVHMEYSTTKSEQMGYKYFLNPGFELGLVYLDW